MSDVYIEKNTLIISLLSIVSLNVRGLLKEEKF